MTISAINPTSDGVQAEQAHEEARGELHLPFTFAKQHGVLLDCKVEPPLVLYRTLPSIAVLTELRRYLGSSFNLQAAPEGEFQKRLGQGYQRGNNEAVQMYNFF